MTSPTRALPVEKKPETVKEGSFLRLADANRLSFETVSIC